MRIASVCFLIAASLPTGGCGIFTAPLSLPAAVAQNANFSFNGKVVDGAGQSLGGVIVTLTNSHHVWAPLSGSRDQGGTLTRRVDGKFAFEARGSSCDFTFSKDGYHDANFHFDADRPDQVSTRDGLWHNADGFPVVMLSDRTPRAPLIHLDSRISYADYPVADAIALPNLATNGKTGDVTYAGKNADDPAIFPAGTLYITLDREPPAALNAKGDIDLAELDIPHHVTLHLPGRDAGFVSIEPRLGFVPLKTADIAPAAGYVNDLTFTRVRLKEMRSASRDRIIEAHEYFYFHAGRFYGKGVFSWAVQSGRPAFEYDLYVQPEPDSRDLSSHSLGK